MPKIKISISAATAVFVLLFAAINFSPWLLIAALAALLHEFGHITASILCKIRLSEIVFYPFGADIKIAHGQIVPYKTDILIKSSGIIANLIAGLGSYLFLIASNGIIVWYGNFDIGRILLSNSNVSESIIGITDVLKNISTSAEAVGFFLVCNLGIAAVNAIPIGALDGGEVLTALLSLKYEPETVIIIMNTVSFVFIVILWIIACYFIMFYGTNFNLLIICAYLFFQLFISKK